MGKRIADISFAWKLIGDSQGQNQGATVKYFRVYREVNQNGSTVSEFLGVTNSMIYVDKDVDMEQLRQLGYRVDAVSHNGGVIGSMDVVVDEKAE